MPTTLRYRLQRSPKLVLLSLLLPLLTVSCDSDGLLQTNISDRRLDLLTEGGIQNFSKTSILESPLLQQNNQENTSSQSQPSASSADNVSRQYTGEITKILDSLQVSTAQLNVQTTPIAASREYVYIANIEHGPDGDTNGVNLRTVVRQGKISNNGTWEWNSFVVEGRTIHDQWHTSPSVAVDREGYIHVVYNMHNLPWQYKRSINPHDITQWEFLGQEITQRQIEALKFENKVSYPTHGTAAIPGNQITYPAFFYDNDNQLYLSFRFAGRPAKAFQDRTFSGGLAKYNVEERTWSSIGGEVANLPSDFNYSEESRNNAIALAAETGWTVYHPRIVFDSFNNIGVFHFWRMGIAGENLARPCFYVQNINGLFQTIDGRALDLPVSSNQCGNMGYSDDTQFYGVGNATSKSSGEVKILVSPVGDGPRVILSYSEETQEWEKEEAPGSAIEIFYDDADNLWAATHRFSLYRRLANDTTWQKVYEDTSGNECYPKAKFDSTGSVAYIHTHSCDSKSISVYRVPLDTP